MHFWSFGPNIGLSDPFGAVPEPKNNANKVLRWFLPQDMLSWAYMARESKFWGLAGLFGALLVGWLVVVARRPYLERHLFTLWRKPLANS